MMDMISILNEFFEEYLSFMIQRQPDTSHWLKRCGRKIRILIDVWLCIKNLLDRTSPEDYFVRRGFILLQIIKKG